MERKFTDAEIVKAVECFAIDKDFDERQCVGCAFETKGLCCENCSEGIAKASLDLINRQKAEIERLEVELKAMRGAANSYKAYSERLRVMTEGNNAGS